MTWNEASSFKIITSLFFIRHVVHGIILNGVIFSVSQHKEDKKSLNRQENGNGDANRRNLCEERLDCLHHTREAILECGNSIVVSQAGMQIRYLLFDIADDGSITSDVDAARARNVWVFSHVVPISVAVNAATLILNLDTSSS